MNLTALKQLAERATQGRWSYDTGITSDHPVPNERGKAAVVEALSPTAGHVVLFDPYDMQGLEQMDADGRFIAAANPAVVLRLIRVVEAAKAWIPLWDDWRGEHIDEVRAALAALEEG